jgi:hypothetical protein
MELPLERELFRLMHILLYMLQKKEWVTDVRLEIALGFKKF